MIRFIVPAAQDWGMREYLGHWGLDVADRIRIIHAESLPGTTHVASGTYVFSALDQYAPGLARFLAQLRDALASHDGVRVLNDPTRTLRRFALLEALHRSGHNVFRAVRVTGDLRGLRYPVFVRDSDAHDGALTPLLRTPGEVETAVGRLIVQGYSARRLMVVEFCDTADASGYYRKYSAFVVGPHIVPRSLSWSREWMLKFQDGEFTPAAAEEELAYVRANPHESMLREVFELAGVGYGRIDYAMKDDRVQTWEINLNPTIGRGLRKSSGKAPPAVNEIRQVTKTHFYQRFRQAWEDVDIGCAEGASVDVAIDEATALAAMATNGAHGGLVSTLRRVLRPMKPVIAPLVARAAPVIGRRAMRRADG